MTDHEHISLLAASAIHHQAQVWRTIREIEIFFGDDGSIEDLNTWVEEHCINIDGPDDVEEINKQADALATYLINLRKEQPSE